MFEGFQCFILVINLFHSEVSLLSAILQIFIALDIVNFKNHKIYDSIYIDTNYLLHFAIYKALSYDDFINKLKRV